MGIPIPPIDLFFQMVDTLAKRYGWSLTEIKKDMWWEEVYEMYEYATNLNTLEKNEDMQFQFMIHATSQKAVDSWRDLALPFPDRAWKPAKSTLKETPLPSVFASKRHTAKGTPETRKRAEEVRERVLETQKKAAELRRAHHYR